MATGLLPMLLAGGGMTLPPCALCTARPTPDGPRTALTLVLGTVVCAEHAAQLADGLVLLPGLLATADELGWATNVR